MSVTWTAPGPGEWVRLADHYDRGWTAEYQRISGPTFEEGTTRYLQALGVPVKGVHLRTVNGFPYFRPLPRVGPAASTKSPPTWLLWIVARVHPSLRRAERTARRALQERPWRAVAATWWTTERQAAIEANLALGRIDVESLDPADLARHLDDVAANATAGYLRHYELHGSDMVPVGLWTTGAERWDITAPEALACLFGHSDATTGVDPAIDEMRAAVDRAGATPASLDELAALAPEPLADYLERHGDRLVTAYDLDGRSLRELPRLVLAGVLARPVAAVGAEAKAHADDRAARLRERVPSDERADFDRLLADARAVYGMRDDNGAILGAWPMGLLRRAMLAAGRQLVAIGVLDDDALAIEATVPELRLLLGAPAGQAPPSLVAELATRSHRRSTIEARDAPVRLGGPEPLPPVEAFPPATATVARAIYALADSLAPPAGDGVSVGAEPDGEVLTESAQNRPPKTSNRDLGHITDSTSNRSLQDVSTKSLVATGLGIGAAAYEGKARVVRTPDEAVVVLEVGDVLVVPVTNPAYNAVLALAGAVVVEEGGNFSHAAVIARELGIPAIVGARGACRTIADGSTVVVDPAAGEVRTLMLA